MMKVKEEDRGRNISLLEFLERLQDEYLLYELRIKLYPSKADKEKYRDVLEYKKEKIQDISEKNELYNIFNSESKRQEVQERFLNEFGNPKGLSGRDKYFYYFIGSDFSYKGRGVKLVSYNLDKGIALISSNEEEIEVDLNEIKRIL